MEKQIMWRSGSTPLPESIAVPTDNAKRLAKGAREAATLHAELKGEIDRLVGEAEARFNATAPRVEAKVQLKMKQEKEYGNVPWLVWMKLDRGECSWRLAIRHGNYTFDRVDHIVGFAWASEIDIRYLTLASFEEALAALGILDALHDEVVDQERRLASRVEDEIAFYKKSLERCRVLTEGVSEISTSPQSISPLEMPGAPAPIVPDLLGEDLQ